MMTQKVRIISKREGFRRGGIAHPETATFYELDRFSKAELEALTKEPMLVVDIVDVPDDDGKPEKVVATTKKTAPPAK